MRDNSEFLALKTVSARLVHGCHLHSASISHFHDPVSGVHYDAKQQPSAKNSKDTEVIGLVMHKLQSFLCRAMSVSVLATALAGFVQVPASATTDVYTQLALGAHHSCGLLKSGGLKCWGMNSSGQLGLGYASVMVTVPTVVPDIQDATSIALGNDYTCAALKTGVVKCWGGNQLGQLGIGRVSAYEVSPSPVQGVADAINVWANGNSSCALLDTHALKCWPVAAHDQTPVVSSAVAITLGSDVADLALGNGSSCVLTSQGTPLCWGFNTAGQLGVGYASYQIEAPTAVTGLGGANAIAFYGGSACGIFESHQMKCWGLNDSGQTGIGSRSAQVLTPVEVLGLNLVNSIALGQERACAVTGSGRIECWGWNYYGQLGLGYRSWTVPKKDEYVLTPSLIPGIDSAVSVFSGASHSCAVLSSGQVQCWGLNERGQLGLGYYSTSVSTPTILPGVRVQIGPDSPSNIDISNVAATSFDLQLSMPEQRFGSDPVTGYEYSLNAGSTWVSLSSPPIASAITISGLQPATSYSLIIRGMSSEGPGEATEPISLTTLAIPASSPTISGVTAGNGQAILTIAAPSQIDDSSISGYDYSTNNGSTWSRFASATGPFTITGLTNATAYQVKVRAVNSAGAGDSSAAVTVNPTKLIPVKPVVTAVVGGNASATVNITTPTDVTAQSITGYQYSINKGATYQNAVVSNGSFSITGLTNGVSTSVQIRATNFNGNSLPSVAKAVVPATTPAAPSITTITPGAVALSIAFTAPITGGSAITSYQYSLDGGSTWVVPKAAVKSSPLKIKGLPNGTQYQVKVRAINAKGIGSASDVVSASTLVLVPAAPTISSITKGRTTLTVDVNAPVKNGGAVVTNYAYSVSGGAWVTVSPASSSTHIVITGLKINTLYPIRVAAINSAGQGAFVSSSARTLQ